MKRQLSRLKALSDRLEGRSTLLKERRTALISAAVTGKIDVRNWKPNTSTQVAESDLPMAAEQAAEYRV
jgi:type I restriction enzyme S subunit